MRALLRWGGALLVLALIGVAVIAWIADTSIGHRLIADRIEALRPVNGLRVKVGRIDGSIYGATRVRDLRLYDTKGQFLSVPEAALDWSPFAWLSNRLDIDRLIAPAATLDRLPALVPSKTVQPILPSFDIRIGALKIERMTFGEGIVKPARMARIAGKAEIQGGRALIDLNGVARGGDRLVLKLDSAPDRNVFDIAATVDAPKGGVITGMLGATQPLALRIEGDGSWKDWKGALVARAGNGELARLALTATSGRYGLNGVLHPDLVTTGRVARLTGAELRVTGNATLANRQLDTHLALASPALAMSANGVVDLARSSFDAMRVEVKLRQPQAVLPNMTGRDIAALVLLDGPFGTANFDYRVTAPRIAFDATGFDDVRVTGRGKLSPQPVIVPVSLSARRVTGVGDIAGGILNNLRVDGLLRVTSKLVTGDGLKLRSDKLNGTISLLLDLATGRYDVGLSGQLNRYLIPGLGIVDVKSVLKVVPDARGGVRVVGRGQVWVRRLDNSFLAGLAGGLPYIDTALERGADGVIRFTGLKLTARDIAITGSGYRRLDGTFFFEGSGRQRRYGPVRLRLDGNIARPKVDLILANPLPSAGLRDVRASLVPTAQGFEWVASGGSRLGPFKGNGQILLPNGGQAVIRIASLTASGVKATGDLRAVTGGLVGQVAVSGGGLTGTVALGIERGIQRVEAHLNARDVKLVGPPLIVIQRGRLDAVALLDPRGTDIDATFVGQGLRYGEFAFARAAANAKLVDGTGQVKANFAGSRGRGFDIRSVVDVSPDRFVVNAEGTVDKRPIKLNSPAVITREGDAWRLAPTAVSFAGGSATVGGKFGGAATELDATVERLPLTVLDIVQPDLGLGGSASGRITFRQPTGGGTPTGSANLRVRNLTRAGLLLVSTPVDAGVNAVLDGNGLAVRAIAVSAGKTIGQAQARIAPLGGGASLYDRLDNAPLFAQLRYNGPADTLWRLTGVESFDVSGPLAIGADVTGSIARPVIKGSLRTENLRLESPVSGTVLTGLKAFGRFDQSRLVIDQFTANAGRGTVAGKASFDLAAASGFGMDISIDAKQASLIARDDFAATVTGPLRIVSNGPDGRISGDVVIDRGAFRLGQATAAQQVPTLKVREINRPFGSPRIRAAPTLWALDVKARADSQLAVTGLGLDSEWSADLNVTGSLDAPRIVGRADVVRGGYEFAGKRFELTRGVIRFQGAFPPDPVLDIVASSNIQSLNATVSVTGTGQKPVIAFTSIPALPQDELLSRLLFGTSITNLSAPEALQLAAAVASLRGGGGLDPINAVRKAIGLDRLRFVAADASVGNKTALAVGKYITRRTYVELITDGQGYSATRVEFAITRWLSLLSTISTVGRQSASVRVSKDY
ncbi:translocation/assembly module TamB domain-containing protein [Sphingomonas sp. SUN039]|uniref:translocation/assembly module TamB domain-containing protein n=1 Tax=Sphingomonas sp. SUN039 TaxID=2937787 RepID=UPI002164ED21|nr:translocation/assembly module TamB domain-containing protein [Sphingomonas sp. SUN039]UVO54334.1 translocation/assembly module TamB domain-containing protein [Sphingomonas sp. SUN039]